MARRWLALADPARPEEGAQGFVLVSAQIVGPGDAIRPMPPAVAPASEEGGEAASVMLSPGVRQESAFLVASVQRAVHLPKMDSFWQANTRSSRCPTLTSLLTLARFGR